MYPCGCVHQAPPVPTCYVCHSFFIPAQSAPALNQWFYAYRVTILNEGERIMQIRSRHWVIIDDDGKKEEVRWVPAGHFWIMHLLEVHAV